MFTPRRGGINRKGSVMASAKPTMKMYERGTNERLDALLEENEVVWIVNGPRGRVPISASTKEEALEKYQARKAA